MRRTPPSGSAAADVTSPLLGRLHSSAAAEAGAKEDPFDDSDASSEAESGGVPHDPIVLGLMGVGLTFGVIGAIVAVEASKV